MSARPRHERFDRRHVWERRWIRTPPVCRRSRRSTLFTTVSREMLDGTRRCVDISSPDLVIYENMHGAGAVAAAEHGIPAVEHAIVWAAPPEAFVSAMWPALTGEAPHVPAVAAIGIAPPSLAPAPDPGWSIRPVPYTGGAVVPIDAGATRTTTCPGDRWAPSVLPRTAGVGLLRELLGALAQEPVEVLVASARTQPNSARCPPRCTRIHGCR